MIVRQVPRKDEDMAGSEGRRRPEGWVRLLCPVALWLSCFAVALELVRLTITGRSVSLSAQAAAAGTRTPEFSELVHAVANTAGALMLVGLALTFAALVLLVISGVKRHWSKLHSATVVMIAAAVLLGSILV
jgi:hypothetical protein